MGGDGLVFPVGTHAGLRGDDGTPAVLSEEEAARLAALHSEQETIEAEYAQADEFPGEVDAHLGEIEQAIEALEERPVSFDPADMARAGAFVSLDTDGTLLVEPGFVRPEDVLAEPKGRHYAPEDDDDAVVYHSAGDDGDGREGAPDTESEEEDGLKPFSDCLLTELLHTLVRDLYWQVSGADCLEAYVREIPLQVHSPDMPGSLPAHALRQRNEGWKHDLPEDEDTLWHWLDGLDDTSRLALLAHCLSFGINARHESSHGLPLARSVRERLARAERLATVLRLDLAEAGWPVDGGELSRSCHQGAHP